MKEKKFASADLKELALNMEMHLGSARWGRWRVDLEGTNPQFVQFKLRIDCGKLPANRPEIHMLLDEHLQRVEIRGSLPVDSSNRTQWPNRWIKGKREAPAWITCDARRRPEEIARDVVRRFLPKFIEQYNDCAKRVIEEDVKRAAAFAQATSLGDALNVQVRSHAIHDEFVVDATRILSAEVESGETEMYAALTVAAHTPGAVEIKLRNVPFITAMQIAQLLASREKEEKLVGIDAVKTSPDDAAERRD